jgi:hypothetical protein
VTRILPKTGLVLALILALLFGAYHLWTPGQVITDGRHDRRTNAIWLQHGWLGDDAWFERHRRQARLSFFRNTDEIRKLAELLRRHGITDVFPHLCPASPEGAVPAVDDPQTQRFLAGFQGLRVLPWVGGVSGTQVFLADDNWRRRFVASVRVLLESYPQFAGIHLNIEPCPSGSQGFLHLLEELRAALPHNKLISVAAYPPPTLLHPFGKVHWDRHYYQEVARRVDQIAVMLYDTSLRLPKLYQWLLAAWTKEVLAWCPNTDVLLGLPAYDDPGVAYHDPRVENLWQAFQGIHAGLNRLTILPDHYRGVALYCEWEMEDHEWQTMTRFFERPDLAPPPR